MFALRIFALCFFFTLVSSLLRLIAGLYNTLSFVRLSVCRFLIPLIVCNNVLYACLVFALHYQALHFPGIVLSALCFWIYLYKHCPYGWSNRWRVQWTRAYLVTQLVGPWWLPGCIAICCLLSVSDVLRVYWVRVKISLGLN